MYGNKISVIRLARGFSQDHVARQLNLTQSEYSKIENNQRVKLTDELLHKIAEALGVSLHDIKSPSPILMNFKLPENNRAQHPVVTHRIIEELTHQLHVKDEQIERLMKMIDR